MSHYLGHRELPALCPHSLGPRLAMWLYPALVSLGAAQPCPLWPEFQLLRSWDACGSAVREGFSGTMASKTEVPPAAALSCLTLAPEEQARPGPAVLALGALGLLQYLLPLILGGREDRKQLGRMEASLSELSGSVAQTVTQLQTTLAALQELLLQQQQKVQELAHELATAKATTSTNWLLESQNINELKSEINSLKGLLLNRRQFPPSPSAPKIPSWQMPVQSAAPSSPAAVSHHSSSDISPVSNESASPSPGKESHSPEGSTATYHLLGPQEAGEGAVDVKGQVRMEVQGEEEKREDEEDEEDDVGHVDEEDCLGVQREDRRGGDGQINEQVEKLRRPEGASNEHERD